MANDHYLGLSLHGQGAVARAQGDFDRSRTAFEESLPLFKGLEDTENVAWTFEHLGVTAIEQGDFTQANAYLLQGFSLFQGIDQRWPCAEALMFLGHAALQQANYAVAEKYYKDALAIYEEMEDKLNIATINSYVGATLFGRGDYVNSVRLYKENLRLSYELKDHWGLAWGMERLAEAAEKLDKPEHAARLWGAADSLRRVSGVLWHPGFHSYYSEQRFASLKLHLGGDRWAELWREGQSFSSAQVLGLALEI